MRRFVLFCILAPAVAYVIGLVVLAGHEDASLPRGADAVVALAGSDRSLSAAQTLIGGGIAPNLVVSVGRSGKDARRTRLCRSKQPDVVCLYAGPFVTVGEAKAVTQLAKRRNWDTLILVTSDYEVLRAERSFRRCGPFRIVGSGVEEPWWRTAIGIPIEWVKLAVSETVRRNC